MTKALVVITGASSGFGMALAKLFSASGYPLLLIARRIDRLESMQLPLCICRAVDVTNPSTLAAAIAEAEAKFGPTDLLINNAGVMLLGDIATQDPSEWKRMIDVNLLGVMYGMQIVIPQMRNRKQGTIINISSVAGLQPFGNHAAYCATKYGVRGLSQTARMELSPFNVRVICIEPGAVDTELLGHTTSAQIIEGYNQWKEKVGATQIQAEDVAKTILFAYELPQGVLLREIIITDTKQDA